MQHLFEKETGWQSNPSVMLIPLCFVPIFYFFFCKLMYNVKSTEVERDSVTLTEAYKKNNYYQFLNYE